MAIMCTMHSRALSKAIAWSWVHFCMVFTFGVAVVGLDALWRCEMLAISLAAATPILPSADGARNLLASCVANAYPALATTAHLPTSIQTPFGTRHGHKSATLRAHMEHIEDAARIHLDDTPITAGTHIAYLLVAS